MVVLITGANGQLGQSLRHVANQFPDFDFVFADSAALDITDEQAVKRYFSVVNPAYCINTAAYTAVDKAESEPEKAFRINEQGPRNLAEACRDSGAVLIHVSTDFVFDGLKHSPYNESDVTNPKSIYGLSKLAGEKAIEATFGSHIIIRTSWLYSAFGHNFMKTMIRLANERNSLAVVNDQSGTPTSATDLAMALLQIIRYNTEHTDNQHFGRYHFSNEGQCSWFEFARKIFEVHKIEIDLQPISTIAYPTPAERPRYSVLDKTKIKAHFDISIDDWKASLVKIVMESRT